MHILSFLNFSFLRLNVQKSMVVNKTLFCIKFNETDFYSLIDFWRQYFSILIFAVLRNLLKWVSHHHLLDGEFFDNLSGVE